MPLTQFYENIHRFLSKIGHKIVNSLSKFIIFSSKISQKVRYSSQIDNFQKNFPFFDTKKPWSTIIDLPVVFWKPFSPICHWRWICTSSQYFWEKLFVYLNDDIFGENNHQELLNEDSNRTERGFCGHGRIQVVNSRKIRAILRYFVNFVELHLFVIT